MGNMAFTISEVVSYEEEIKKSRFQAIAIPVETEHQIKTYLDKYYDHSTAHQCWAWKIGNQLRFNDDGEPSGTAGRPILATIEGNELTNILVIVNRWFGGIKLGTGGLVRAYGGCAGQCLSRAEKKPLIHKESIHFSCHFNEWSILEYELKQHQIVYTSNFTAEGVIVEADVEIDQIEPLSLKINHVTRGREKLKRIQPQDEQ